YTKTGDQGETGLYGGQRVSKCSIRVEAYGAVDELNSNLGWAAAQLSTAPNLDHILRIQSELLSVGSDLATPSGTNPKPAAKANQIGPDHAAYLESLIDRLETEVAPLKNFILPGGDPGAAALHVCRTVCRRAERAVVRLSETEPVNPAIIIYLNRLSDLLFVMARRVNAQQGVEEPIWKP
ncbi:MAG TPA: cob(I)yrinic acid a,c-diamide adenosyltransferase, partial [Armatimonadota bacterium]|nr:cob(I)yrinic acid a,c-diamide adenosyltransferase [Armatimonadota bacterium]